jgi:hypothetical protein
METATCGERNHYLWRCIGPAQGKETTMTFEPRSLEVFQDCALFDSPGGPPFIRDALLTNVVPPWRHNREREEEASKHTIGDADIMVFERAAADELPSGCLFLFSTPNGYEVSNIVPTNPGQLGYSKYNALLQNFVTLVVNPATERANFKVRLTAPHQSINDWVSSRTATALRQFSAAANKSTGSSHPLDRKRWLSFVISAHQETIRLDPSRLARWLHEADGWDEDSAHDLAIQYEFGLDLLDANARG